MTDDELTTLLARALDEDAPAAPPADRITALRARAAALAPTQPARRPDAARCRDRRWLAVAAVFAALLAGFGASRLLWSGSDDGSAAGTVEYDGSMTGPDGEPVDASLRVVATGIGRIVDLRTDVLPILPTGELYEVWFVAADDAPGAPARISAGTFHPAPDGRSDVRFAAAVDPALYPVVEVTAEPGDGNPLPTGPIVLRTTIGT